jgi:hypothetical protein
VWLRGQEMRSRLRLNAFGVSRSVLEEEEDELGNGIRIDKLSTPRPFEESSGLKMEPV